MPALVGVCGSASGDCGCLSGCLSVFVGVCVSSLGSLILKLVSQIATQALSCVL